MFPRIPWRPLQAVLWDSLKALLAPLIPRPFLLSSRVGVPVFIMLPLDTALPDPAIPTDILRGYLTKLKQIGVTGIMVDVWWGSCEPAPGDYRFDTYIHLIEMCQQLQLQVQAVMSFHSCGGNVGDTVNIPLPVWVIEAADEHGLWFLDDQGATTKEYITFGADTERVLPVGSNVARNTSARRSIPQEIVDEALVASTSEPSQPAQSQNEIELRTPIETYVAFVAAFLNRMSEAELLESIAEIQLGMGPCGELRYPSYPLADDKWKFPGIGKFQCFDKYMLCKMYDAIEKQGNGLIKAASLPPRDAGDYNDTPWDTQFFTKGFKSDSGKWFLRWYFGELLRHGEHLLKGVREIAPDTNIAVKISGVHWWRFSSSRAAEATAGYINGSASGYSNIAQMLKQYEAVFDFTCLEMRTIDQPFLTARCGPRQLVYEVFRAAARENVTVAGENALERLDWPAFKQIIKAYEGTNAKTCGFTLLRLNERMMETNNLETVRRFVKAMNRI